MWGLKHVSISSYNYLIIIFFQNMVGSEGLPLNVQVVALPWQEEQVLRVMKEIETGVKQ